MARLVNAPISFHTLIVLSLLLEYNNPLLYARLNTLLVCPSKVAMHTKSFHTLIVLLLLHEYNIPSAYIIQWTQLS